MTKRRSGGRVCGSVRYSCTSEPERVTIYRCPSLAWLPLYIPQGARGNDSAPEDAVSTLIQQMAGTWNVLRNLVHA